MNDLAALDAAFAAWPVFRERVAMLVIRKPEEGRETPASLELCPDRGVVGDRWQPGDTPDAQVSLMEHRCAHALLNGEQIALAGDNLIVDIDLIALEPGARISVGTAVLEISPKPHRGCAKFIERYGVDAQRWVNVQLGRRGRYARVVTGGTVALDDRVRGGTQVDPR